MGRSKSRSFWRKQRSESRMSTTSSLSLAAISKASLTPDSSRLDEIIPDWQEDVSNDGIFNESGPDVIVEDEVGLEDVSEDDAPSVVFAHGQPSIKPRAYQLEMLAESMQRNVILAMDTGSGKTHVAVLRMLEELARMPPHQCIWFMAPSVDLCVQQVNYIKTYISSVQIRLFTGSDGIEKWTEQRAWDAVMTGVRIVVSTYQILLEALSHAFIRMESLALIVFDEVHNCVGKHPGAKIMDTFYHPEMTANHPVPHILGLTASPTISSTEKSLNAIESTMNALCRTPTQHRSELRQQVRLPVLSQVFYTSQDNGGYTESIRSLKATYLQLNIHEDPFILELQSQGTDRSRREYEKRILNQKTHCREQIKSLLVMAQKVYEELGSWAADYYISEVIKKVIKLAKYTESNSVGFWGFSSAEKVYLANSLSQVKLPESQKAPSNTDISDKFVKLMSAILPMNFEFAGIIFVTERAMVPVLGHLISVYLESRDRFRIGLLVGSSTYQTKNNRIGELLNQNEQKNTLTNFRSGKINLVVATSVLEEGIDVPACNMVACFSKPANLKSFVQRRGRARQRDSRLVLLLDQNKDRKQEWDILEAEMKGRYEDDMRALRAACATEDAEDHDGRYFRVSSTGAILDIDNAMSHLYHFCATLPKQPYVDMRPEFICFKEGPGIRARIILPHSVAAPVRVTESRDIWKSEKNAIKDAAFESYVSLYHAGLVNENLLPLLQEDAAISDLKTTSVETRASMVRVDEQIEPWISVAKAWGSSRDTTENNPYKTKISHFTLRMEGLEMALVVPIEIPPIAPFKIFWDADTVYEIEIEAQPDMPSREVLHSMPGETIALLDAAFGARFSIEEKLPVLLFAAYTGILEDSKERKLIRTKSQLEVSSPGELGLIRNPSRGNTAYIYKGWLEHKPPIGQVQHPYDGYEESLDVPHLALRKLPRRYGFLHPISRGSQPVTTKPYSYVLPITKCTLDIIPSKYILFAMLIPSISRRLSVHLVADGLSRTILSSMQIPIRTSLLSEAITSSSAQTTTNYERLEFLGDSILKFCASIQLLTKQPLWPEGYLSEAKDRLVANSRLARAAVEIGLPKFIVTAELALGRWRVPYVEDLIQNEGDLTVNMDGHSKRDLSSKILADVVEALVGAATVEGGTPAALSVLRIFLPELEWPLLSYCTDKLRSEIPDTTLPCSLEPLEHMLGYRFNKKHLLIEAMTHASYTAGTSSGSSSLERLEFLGDAVLDNIVVGVLYANEVELGHHYMHLLRTAVVNADFLAWICMKWSVEQDSVDMLPMTSSTETLDQPATKRPPSTPVIKSVTIPLCNFLRHASAHLATDLQATLERHKILAPEIADAVYNAEDFPWTELLSLQAPKFLSDIIESILGAVYIDSGGSLRTCHEVANRAGIVPVLRRLITDNVNIMHPRQEIGTLASSERVKYVINSKEAVGPEGETSGMRDRGDIEYTCQVFVSDVLVGEAQETWHVTNEVKASMVKTLVKTKAAKKAVQFLKQKKEKGRLLEMPMDQ